MRMHRTGLHLQPILQGMLPEAAVPVGEWISAPNIIDQNIQLPALLVLNPLK
ncbi:hypothetical protein D3C81_1137470 [compost metagenome]